MSDLPPQPIVTESEGLTVPLILWRKFRGPRPGLLERTLALNPGLAGAGPRLPVATAFLLPVDRPTAPVRQTNLVTLWS